MARCRLRMTTSVMVQFNGVDFSRLIVSDGSDGVFRLKTVRLTITWDMLSGE